LGKVIYNLPRFVMICQLKQFDTIIKYFKEKDKDRFVRFCEAGILGIIGFLAREMTKKNRIL